MQKVGSHLSPHYTVGDVAEMLGLTQAQVRTLIHTKQLPAEKKGNEYRVLAADFERYCAGTRGSQVDKREVVCTRRGFLRGASLWVLGAAFQTGVGLALGIKAQQFLESSSLEHDARELFRQLFGFRAPGEFDYIYGRPGYWGSYHPYHQFAGDALLEPLGLAHVDEPTRRLPHGVPQQPHGDKIVFGGPNSTEETAQAWGFQGGTHRELKRVLSLLPLRWYGISAESELGAETGVVIVYGMGQGRVAETRNWPIVDLVMGGSPLISHKVRSRPTRWRRFPHSRRLAEHSDLIATT